MTEFRLEGLDIAFFASPIARREETDASAEWVRKQLAEYGGSTEHVAGEPSAGKAGPGKTTTAGTGAPFALPLAVVLTGGTEAKVLEWLDGRGGAPPALLALTHSNSLPACLEVLARLRQQGRQGRIIVANRGPWRDQVYLVAKVARAAADLKRARLGFLGGPSTWLAASSPAPELVQKVWGPRVTTVPLSEVVERYRKGGAGPWAAQAADLKRLASETVEPDDAALSGALRLYGTLKGLCAERGFDAISVRCFDLLEALRTSGCVALSRLNDEGVTAGCEGDLPATLTMMAFRYLTGQASFVANPSDVDVEEGTITFAHCSVPLSIVRSFRLRSHFESGIGVGIEGQFVAEVATVARLGGERLNLFRVFEGKLVRPSTRGGRADLCRTQVTLDVGSHRVRDLLERPLGNHYVIMPGRHAEAFSALAEAFGGVAG